MRSDNKSAYVFIEPVFAPNVNLKFVRVTFIGCCNICAST